MELVTNWLWQSVLIVAATSAILLCAGRLGTRFRYTIWAVTFAGLASLPLLQVVVPLLPASSIPVAAPSGVVPLVTIPHDRLADRLLLSVALVWIAVHALALLRAAVWLRRAKSRAVAVPESLQRRLPAWSQARRRGRFAMLAISRDVHAAAALGFGTPLIAISPRLIEHLSADDLDRIVMHEWAHVQRRDDYVSLVERAVATLAGWHPAIWWTRRQLAREREMICDEAAVAATGTAKAYASALVRVATLTCGRAEMAPALGVVTRSGLQVRVQRVLVASRNLGRGVSLALTGVAIVVVGVLTFSSAALSIVEAAVPDGLPQIALDRVTERLQSAAALPAQLAAGDRVAEAPPKTSVQATATLDEAAAAKDIDRAGAAAVPAILAAIPSELLGSATPPRVTPLDGPPLASRPVVAPPAAVQDDRAAGLAVSAPVDEVRESADARDDRAAGWSRAADAGQAIGSGAQNAGVATGRFFSGLAGRIADSF